ncbi:MAG: HAMP domain-containing histidine kinase [Bacteroidetes bacterium]|nr:HAMP domain-containing histidine kinase [Bacteroidota bacterium]
MKKFLTIRWIMMAMALVAILSLTGMNVYSLYALHESTISSASDRQKTQLSDFAYTTRNRFRAPVEGIWKLNMEQLHDEVEAGDLSNPLLAEILAAALADPLFDAIYFARPDFSDCSDGISVYTFSPANFTFTNTMSAPLLACDGISLTRTRMKVLLNDYRWNTKVVFDTHRTMNVAMINPRGAEIVGYLAFSINKDYLINDFFAVQLNEAFGPRDQSGMTIWLHDWLLNEVLATNDTELAYSRRDVEYIQRFPDLLDNWNLKVRFDDNPAVLASLGNLQRNMFVMGGVLVLLLGSLGIMFIIAQKERSLMERQAGFLANVTHELKTPLAVMQAAGENLADGRVTNPDRLKTYGEHIHTESLRLRRMIEKLLDVAKNDAGQLIVKPQPYNLGSLVRSYIAEHMALFTQSGFDPHLEIPDSLPSVLVDKDSFETILGNLVENAMKYSGDSKYVAIRLKHDQQRVILQVEDKGLGIPGAARKHIFDKFYRVEDTLTARTKGHGLGLSIVKNLVELNNATVSVESTYRKGSVFSVTFPIHVAPAIAQTETLNPKAKIEYAS